MFPEEPMNDKPDTPSPAIHIDDVPWLLTPRQAAYLLDIAIPEVHRLVRRGTLKRRSSNGVRWIETSSVRELHHARHVRRLQIGRAHV